MKSGDILKSRSASPAQYWRIDGISHSGKSVRVVQCHAGGGRLPKAVVMVHRASTIERHFECHAQCRVPGDGDA